jgi:hypothetical protein
VSGANNHDSIKLEALLGAKIVEPEEGCVQNLCLDTGYVGQGAIAEPDGYVPHIRPRGEEKAMAPLFPPRRWIVELGTLVVQPVPQTFAALREDGSRLSGVGDARRCHDCLNKVIAIYG